MAVNVEGASPPVFEQIFRNARFAQGGNALFEGKVKGNPKPQVVWTRKGLQMKGNEKHQMIYDENSGKVSLMIKAIGPGDEGEYTCTALNPYGEAICTVYISPEATKQVKKSRSGHKLHKSSSNKQVQLAQQQQLQMQQQQQLSQQQQFSSSQSQEISQQTSMQQQSSNVQQFSQQSSSSVQQASMQQSSSSVQQASMTQESASMSSSSMQFKQQSSSSSIQQSTQQQRMMKESEPEVIYLKHVERQQQQQIREEEKTSKYASPSFLTPLRDLTVNEGEKAHFDAKVGPVGDPSMKVEWYFNGQLITASSRINSTCQFGFVALEMLNSSTNDAGEYTCVVKNDAGTTQSACRLTVQARKEMESEFHSQSLRQVEMKQQQQTVTIQEEVMPQKPEFVKPLSDLGEKPEGSNVHLEAQVTPASDATMQIDWFKDGRPITASSRIQQLFSFGYVSLNINGLRAEDAGTYTCRACNAAGEAITQASVQVSVSQQLMQSTGIAEQQQYIEKVQQLESYQASKQMTRMESVTVESTQAPEFKSPILDQLDIKEGGFAHFEARLEPMGDASMKVEWLKDGHAVDASSRITSFFNFGYVALTIKQVALHDAGTYSCVAHNKCGKAETCAKLTTTSRQDSEFQSKQWSSIQQMETRKEVVSSSMQQEVSMAPKFVSQLKGTNVVLEGQRAHFECRLEPQNDPKLTVQWLFNGQSLTASSRIQTNHDFGYVAIDILEAKREDSGEFTLVATNALGSQQASVNLRVDAHVQAVDTSTIHAKTVEETQRFEMKQEMRVEVQEQARSTAPPVFIMPLQDPPKVSEGQNIHFEAKLEPVGDPHMKVEWFFNGRPLTIGSRFRTYNDFGFVALDIVGVIAQDNGQYVCRATNQLGQAETSATVQVHIQSNIVTESEHEVAMQQINYLETSQQVTKQVVEQEVKQPPQFVKPLKNVDAVEGQNVHLEGRLLPTGDSTMNVEWTLNGKPLKTGHKIKPAYDFDYVALDLLTIYPEDSGIYTCNARNAYGEAQTSATIRVQGSGQIVTESSSEISKFASLETKQVYKQEIVDETSQAPVFTSPMKSIEITEGQRAHFECRIIPVSDATLKIEWLHNGAPIKQGSRFKEGLDFGFVSLDIMQCQPEDAGSYTCRATNRLGQAINSADLMVQANQTIVKDTIHQAAVAQINYLESSRVTQTQDEGFTTQAPAFTCQMRDIQIMEGQPAHFEAKLVPVGDSKLRVEWLKDGKPIQASNRMSTLHDFGFVAFDLKYTRPEDAGSYTCRAVNALGEADISANLKVMSAKSGPNGESMHNDALDKIAYLEKKKTSHGLIEEEGVASAPIFVVPLQGKTSLIEGQNVHMECRIEPYPDSSLRVEWFHNDKPLPFGNRWRTSYDFGFAALDILGAYPEDSGKYTLKAFNVLGASESSIDVKIASRSGLLLDSEHTDALDKIRYLESKHQRTAEEEMAVSEAPQFGHQLKDVTLDEAQPAHFETTLTPVNDATMKVEWLCNGKPVPQGHRFRTTYDFGFVALDILYAYPEDCGTYTCRATNQIGEASTSCALTVQGKSGLLLDTMDRDRLTQLKNLEARGKPAHVEGDVEITKPVFTTALNNAAGVVEQGRVHLECRLEPINDPNLKVEWFMSGKAIQTGHRFKTRNDFGFVALDILYAYSEDSGTYMCKATNKLGEAVNTCSVEVVSKTGLLLDSQHPEGWEKVKSLEARGGRGRLEVEEMPVGPPHFVTELTGNTTMAEGQIAHFEAQIEPIHDPELKIEFLHNGKPIKQGSRFHTLCDFGYVALDIGQLVAEDSGEYTCRVYNKHGEATSFTTLNVSAKGTLDLNSQRPEGLDKIKQLESRGRTHAHEELKTFQKPVFTQPLQNVEKEENQNVRFAARIIPVGDTTLDVKWFKNGQVLETGSRINVIHDFGCVSLEITGLRASDEGIYECKASNSLGEAVTTATCKVAAKGSLLLDSVHPEGMKKIAALEAKRPRATDDPDQQFDRPVFVAPLSGTAAVAEGGQAHMECRVAPVGDPNMKFQWLCNGEPVKMGSRVQATQDFGFVTLDIAACIREDSGMYTVKATNLLGEASSSFALNVGDKESIQQPPVFMEQLKDIGVVKEGANVHAEARIEPKSDPNLKVEWELNGKPISSGSRLKTSLDFGHVQLNINGVRSSDSGIYTCKAMNALGDAVSTTSIKVDEQHWLSSSTQNSSALESIQNLEASKRLQLKEDDDQGIFSPPIFVEHVNNVSCNGGDTAHFECKVEPKNDPSLEIKWNLNDKPLSSGSRIIPTMDFGTVILDVKDTVAADSGILTCVATNLFGSASTTGTLKIKDEDGIISATQHPSGKLGMENLDKMMSSVAMKLESSPEDETPVIVRIKPSFTTGLPNEVELEENGTLKLQCNVEPKNDSKLMIDWYHNGLPLSTGSRIKVSQDFGIVTLDVENMSARDQGVYTCKAVNEAGEAVVFTTVKSSGKSELDLSTKHPKGIEGFKAIAEFEAKGKLDTKAEESEEGHAPKFVSEFKDAFKEEGDSAYFEAQLFPKGDSTITIEWLKDGKPVQESSRLRAVHSFGMVILEIEKLSISDAGKYSCTAKNAFGVAASSVTLGCVEKGKLEQAPKFTSQLVDTHDLVDGNSVHWQCTITPVNDPELSIEWTFNGNPLPLSSRLKTISDFGFVTLDICGVDSRDSGEYICKATNRFGQDTTKCTLKCSGKSEVQYKTLQPNALDKLSSFLSDLKPIKTGAGMDSTDAASGPPKFVTQFNSSYDVQEMQGCHLEARLTPAEDPHMNVEWFKDGKPLATGHRFRTFNDFGIVILDVLYCYAEDSGAYECKATNQHGSDSISCTIKCSEKSSLILTPQVPGEMKEHTLSRIQKLESMKMSKSSQSAMTQGVAPRFTVPISNIDDLKEGENAHFEARLIPTDDPTLTIEWYWDGKALKAGSRIRTFCDFGFVILEISPVYPEDSGEYMCKAKNALGEAVTTATLKCGGKRNIIMDSQLPKGMEGAIDQIAKLEGLGRARAFDGPAEDLNQPPEFLSNLEDLVLPENALAHFETRLTPVNDPSMRVEWYQNGKQLSAGSRIKTINDFGFVILEVANVLTRDSGNYTCKATNKHGECNISCNVDVKTKQNIITDPQLPKSFRSGTDSINRLEENRWRREEMVTEEYEGHAPKFVTKIQDVNVIEGQPAHYDCRVEPIGDGSMQIEWYHEGKPIQIGSRLHTISDFGFVVLDIDWTFKRDSGVYTCRAVNKNGSAETKATLTCKSRKDVNIDSQLPQGMSLEKLKELEKGRAGSAIQEDAEITAPKFITQMESRAVGEGEPVHFNCRVEPKHDPKLQIKWYHNEKELPSGSRFRITHEFGYVALDILYVYPEDEGEYVCKAINELGEDITKCTLRCKELPAIQLENQVPKGMKKSEQIVQMEAAMKKYDQAMFLTEDDVYDAEKRQPPRFVTQIQSVTTLVEMQATKFECQLAPVGDPSMKVEWFFNGKALPFKNRFTPIYDFGYVAMNFGWVYPEDSGEYVCRASNAYGMDETRGIIKTAGKPGIVYESQLPRGMESIEKIRKLESGWQRVEQIEVENERFKPCFVTQPEQQTACEGDTARFCCRVTGYPKPRVMWLLNGHTVINGSKHKLVYDGMWHFDIPKCRDCDAGKVEVIARNSCGEAYSTTSLTVTPREDDFRSVLRHNVKRDFVNSKEYKKPEWVTRMEEIQKRLAAQAQSAKFTNELRECRLRCGMKARFEASYAGNPTPEFTWQFNGKELPESDNFKIKVRDTTVSLTIFETTMEMTGYYTCIAKNDLGTDTTRASLTVNKALSPEEKARLDELADAEKNKALLKQKEKEEKKKKLEELEQQKKEAFLAQQEKRKADKAAKAKKAKEPPQEAEKVVLKKKTEVKQPEAAPEAPREVPKLKHVDRVKESSPARSRSGSPIPQLKRVEQQKREESPFSPRGQSPIPKLKPVPKKEAVPEKEPEAKKEPELKPALKKPKSEKKAPPQKSAPPPAIQKEDKVEKKTIVELKAKEETIVEKAKETVQVSSEDFAGPMKELADITVRLEHGATVEEVNSAYEAHEFPKLERKTSQMAMLTVIERLGESATVKQVVTQECTSKAEPNDQAKSLDNIGFTALLTTLANTTHKAEEVITSFQPEDFTAKSSQEQFAKLIQESPELMEVAQATEISKEFMEEVDSVVKVAVETEVQSESVIAESKRPEAQSTVSLAQPEASQATVDTSTIKEGDVFFALATFVSETGEAMNLVEGEKVHVLEWNNTDWWYVRKHLTEESGWVPAQYLKDELTYTMYVQKKLVEKIEKLPVFDKPKEGEASFAPKITEKVRSMAASDGSQVEFMCKVEGSPRPQITWFRQTAIIKPSQDFQIFYYDDNKATLVIKEVFPEDAGTFTCVAKNCVGYASSSAELLVEHPLSEHMGVDKHDRRSLSRESSLADIVEGIPPTFAQRPQTKAADEGSSTELEARFVAIPEAEVQWFHNKVELKEETDRVSIIHQADMHMYCSIIRISNVKIEDEGTYEVCAKNREGEANNTLVLNVKAKEKTPEVVVIKDSAPMIVKPLTPTLCKAGESVKIETVITGRPKPALEWIFNEQQLVASEEVKIVEKDDVYTLIIDNVKQSHDGVYTVKASNSLGCAQTSANISVQADQVIEFVKPLEDVEIKEKDVFELDVELSTDEVADVKWFKDGEVIDHKNETKYEVKRQGRKQSLKIINATVHDEGEYTAAVGEQESTCELTVVELPPEFTKKIEPVKATAGEEMAIFEIEISKGDAITKWFKNGAEVEMSDRVQAKIDGKKQRLEITNVSTTDAGEYSCTIGKEKCTASLDVEEPKVNFEAKLPETTTASVGQEVQITVELSKETEAVQWLKDGKPLEEKAEKVVVKKEGRKRSIIIMQAAKEDIAEYTCVAENVKTKTELELKGSEEQIEAVELEVKEQVATKGQDMTFRVDFKKELHRKPSVKLMKNGNEVESSERIITQTFRTYTIITIKQVDDSDIGPYTAKIFNSVSEVNTGFNLCIKDKPSPPKGPASQEWKTEDSKELRWNAPANDGGDKISEYVVERREKGKKSWKQVGTTQAETTSIEIKGLKKETSYDFRVSAKNSVGNSVATIIEETAISKKQSLAQSQSQAALATSASSTEVAAKAKSAPSAPRDVKVTVVTSLSVTLQWIPPANNGGAELTGYIIEKRLGTKHTWEKAATVETSVTEYTVENLKEKCAYYFRVSAENEVGVGEAASTEKAVLKTSAKAPSAPTAPLEISCLTPHSIMVEWGAPDSDGGAPLEGYKVAVRDAKRQMWMEVGRVTADVQKLQVKDLAEGKEYFIRIFAKNEVGFSDPLENEEPFKVQRPAGYTGEEESDEKKHDETPSLSFTTETMSSWMRDANMDANIQSYTKSSVLRRDDYFFRIWYYGNKLFDK